jgi:uncharacterized protein YhfF
VNAPSDEPALLPVASIVAVCAALDAAVCVASIVAVSVANFVDVSLAIA